MLANFTVVGLIRKIKGGNMDPKTQRPSSAMLTVQYGHKRDNTGGAVEFINALAMRVPSHTWQRLQTQIAIGQVVEIKGKIQGVFKSVSDGGYLTSELVVESVKPIKQETLAELVEAAAAMRAEAAPAPADKGDSAE